MRYFKQVAVWLVCFAALGPSIGSVAHAQDDAGTATARQRFKEGVKYFDSEQYGKARVAFTQAYALRQHPDVLLNLAQSELRTPGYEADAATHFAEYLRQVPNATEREKVEAGLAEAKKKVLTVNIESDTQGAQVLVEGKSQGFTPLPGPLFLMPGTYTVELAKDGETLQEVVVGKAGEETTATFGDKSGEEKAEEATPTAPAPVAVKVSDEDGQQKQPKKREKKAKKPESDGKRTPFVPWLTSRPGGIFLGLLAVGGVGSGVGFALASNREANNADEMEEGILANKRLDDETIGERSQYPCGDGHTVPPVQYYSGDQRYYEWCVEYQDSLDKRDDFRTVSYISFGVGAAAAAGLVTYYFLDSKRGRSNGTAQHERRKNVVQISPTTTRHYNGLSITGRF